MPQKQKMLDDSPSWIKRVCKALSSEPRDRQQLINLLRDAQSRALLDAEALAMIEGAMQVSEMRVRDIMVPRGQMDVVQRDAPPREIVSVIVNSGHSRFPVIGEGRDEITGIVLAKDMLKLFAEGMGDSCDLREFLRPAVFVPESKRLNAMLAEFRSSRNHMAIVVDEYGGIAGLVTIEDVLEQIVGDIDDEHDYDHGDNIFRHDDDLYTLRGLTSIEEFNEYFNAQFGDESYDTVAGLILKELGHMPRRSEFITIGPFRFKVLRSDNRRIYLLQLTIQAAKQAE